LLQDKVGTHLAERLSRAEASERAISGADWPAHPVDFEWFSRLCADVYGSSDGEVVDW